MVMCTYYSFKSHLVALLISSHHAHCLDEGVSRVVHASLDALINGPVVGGCLVPQVCINGWGQGRCHAVVVLPQVREISTAESYQHSVWTNTFHYYYSCY